MIEKMLLVIPANEGIMDFERARWYRLVGHPYVPRVEIPVPEREAPNE